ncbi:MAG: RNA polymerase sigma-70 factor (ECF subfamily) [Candidatus Paceibacteria bacterium]
MARNLVRDPDAAEDLAQEALVVALEHPPRHAQNLRGWLARVLENLHFQGGRRQQWIEPSLPADAERGSSPATYEVVERAEAQHQVAEEVLALEEPYRGTVLLRYFDDLTPKEIAAELNLPLATVTSRLTRAHAQLRERLDRRSGQDGKTWMTALLPVLVPRGPLLAVASGTLVMSTLLKVTLAVILFGVGFVALRSFGGTPLQPEAITGIAKSPPFEEVRAPETKAATIVERTLATEETQEAVAATPPVPDLAGHVFTPAGGPAVGATVVLGADGKLRFLEMGTEPEESLVWCETDKAGRFCFHDVPSGKTQLTAGMPGNAPSELLAIQFEKGEPQTSLDLTLRVGVRIYGDVVRRDGSMARNRKLRLLKDATSTETHGIRLMRNVLTDDQGRFDESHLSPGSWGLVSFPSDEELIELGGTMPEHMIQATVKLEDGQEEFIVLGARPARTVKVSGFVERRDGPGKGLMQWIGECEDPMGSQVISTADKDGHYETELPFGGAWYVRIMASDIHSEHYVDVAQQEEFEQDFVLPTASVSGRIVDEMGAAVAGALVSHMILQGKPCRLSLSTAVDRSKSKKDGSFHFVGMEAGTYQIGVVHSEHGSSQVATVTIEEHQERDGLELVLQRGERLSGVILGPEGLPVSAAPIWIQESSGLVLNPISKVHSNKQGEFVTPPLPPGEYSVVCQVGVLVGFLGKITPGSEGASQLEIQLEEGATLKVQARADEELVRTQVRVLDEQGRVFSGLRDATDPWSWRRYPLDSRTRWIGPLPEGTYRVAVYLEGRKPQERVVFVTQGETGAVEFQF